MKRYNQQYDSFYDEDTNEWIESKCDDPNCSYCTSRPDTPPISIEKALTIIEHTKLILAREYRNNLQREYDDTTIQELHEKYNKEFKDIQLLEEYILHA